jgi:hypothetical protein
MSGIATDARYKMGVPMNRLATDPVYQDLGQFGGGALGGTTGKMIREGCFES